MLLGRRRERALDHWLERLHREGLIVCYDPDMGPNEASTEGGWYYDRRRPEDSGAIVRDWNRDPLDSA